MITPTPRALVLLALGVPLALAGSVLPGIEQLVLPYNIALLITFLATGLVAKKWQAISATRQTDPVLSVRVPNTIRLTLANAASKPIRVIARDEPPENCDAQGEQFSATIHPGREHTHEYTVVPRSRGEWPFRGTFIQFDAPLGLARITQNLPTEAPARVYPNVKALQEFELLKQSGHLNLLGVRKSRLKGLGTEFESLRDYNEDDYRTIDWKASARRGRLVVKNFEQETNQGVMVCVDIGRHMLGEVEGVRKLDYCLDAALLLIHAAERAGDQVGLLIFNDRVERYIAPKKGKAQVAAILSALYDAQAHPVQPDYASAFAYLASRWKRRSLVVLFTDAENHDQAADIAASLGTLRRRHLLYVVRVSDPRLRELIAQPVADDRTLFDHAAALWYIGDRRQADVTLRNNGLHSLEAEPQNLAQELVSAYLRVKQLNQI